jgi:hypothetical protein
MKGNYWAWIFGVAITPAIFWVSITGYDFLRKYPDPFEDLLFGFVAAYLYYGPLFVGAALVHSLFIKRVPEIYSWWRFPVAGSLCSGLAFLFFVLAHFVISLPLVAWPFVVFMGGIIGIWNILLIKKKNA